MRGIQWLAAPILCWGANTSVADSMFDVFEVAAAEQRMKGEQEAASGFRLVLEKTLAAEFLVGASFSRFEPDGADHTQHMSLYVGLYAEVEHMHHTQVAALFGIRQSELVLVNAEQDDKAGMIGVSLRNRAFEKVELQADLEYLDWREGESGFAGLLGASYFVTQSLTADISYRKQGDSEFYTLGFGWHF